MRVSRGIAGRFALVLAVLLVVSPITARPAAAATIEDGIVITSGDGTRIVATLMLPTGASATTPVPALMSTHAWAGRRTRTPDALLQRFLDSGYAVITWDSRGFGESGGEVNLGSPRHEGSDASAIVDYLASRPEIVLDGPGDPRVGWFGTSNAAGIQLNGAANDHRVDAIAPQHAWGDLTQDLAPGGAFKLAWGDILWGTGFTRAALDGAESDAGAQTGTYAPELHRAIAELNARGVLSETSRDWLQQRSTTTHSSRITAPTLILQGTIDTLFPLEDGLANYSAIAATGTPVKLVAHCAGHSEHGCTYENDGSGRPADLPSGNTPVWQERLVAWMERYVKGLEVSTGPAIEWQAQDGRFYSASGYPVPGSTVVRTAETAARQLIAAPTTGGDTTRAGRPSTVRELQTKSAFREVIYAATTPVSIFGVPTVTLTGTATGDARRVFVELIDVAPDGTRVTIDDQVIPVELPGTPTFSVEADLHAVAWRLEPGHRLEVEISSGSAMYRSEQATFRSFMAAVVDLPVVPQ